MTQFGTWLADERKRVSASEVDPYDLACDPVKLTRYVRTYLTGAEISLRDALGEAPYGADPDCREVWEDNRDAFVNHVAEALHRIGHVLVAVGCSGKELASRYEKLPAPVLVESAPDAAPGTDEESPDSDESGTLCADVPEPVEVTEK